MMSRLQQQSVRFAWVTVRYYATVQDVQPCVLTPPRVRGAQKALQSVRVCSRVHPEFQTTRLHVRGCAASPRCSVS